MAEPLRYEAAPLDRRARGLLVGWLTAWFTVVAGLLAWWAAGGGVRVLVTAGIAATVMPLVLLTRLAGFPGVFEIDDNVLRVRRHLLADRSFVIRGPVASGPGPLGLDGGAWSWTGAGFGCRWHVWAADGQRERVYLALTDRSRAVRVGTDRGTVLVSPAQPKPFARAARKAAR